MTVDTSHLTLLGREARDPIDFLEVFQNPRPEIPIEITCYSKEFTCKCPVTGQPDFAEVLIEYVPNEFIVESKSLKLYLMHFRETGAFHEDLAKQIAQDFFNFVKPKFVRVSMDFSPRGGVSISARAQLPAQSSQF